MVRVSDSTPGSPEVNASFYGLAYKLTQSVGTPGNLIAGGTTIISYRGTDEGELLPLDLPMSFLGSYDQAEV